MGEISIKENNHWAFSFFTKDKKDYKEILRYIDQKCSYCGWLLDIGYAYIINCLKEAGLLPEDYKEICCYCYTLIKHGLIDLRENLGCIDYLELDDILILTFNFGKYNANRKLVYNRIPFRIHDYSKVHGFNSAKSIQREANHDGIKRF